MPIINEPRVTYDLTVQLSEIDLEPIPGSPIVGGVLRSDYYADYYFSLSEKERLKERKAIEVKSKRQFFEKITRNNLVQINDHISLKNAYYLSGASHCFFAPEIPKVQHTVTHVNNTNIRDRITITYFNASRIDVANVSSYFLSIVHESNTFHDIFYSVPAYGFRLSSQLQISATNKLTYNGNEVYFIGFLNNIEKIQYVYKVSSRLSNAILFSTTVTDTMIIVTNNYVLFYLVDGTNYIVYLFKKMSKFQNEIKDYVTNLASGYLSFYTDIVSAGSHLFVPTPIGAPIPVSTLNSAAASTLHALFSGSWDPNNIVFWNNYILASVNAMGIVPYNTYYGYDYVDNTNTHRDTYFYDVYINITYTPPPPTSSIIDIIYYFDIATNSIVSLSLPSRPCNNILSNGVISQNIIFMSSATSCFVNVALLNSSISAIEIISQSLIIGITDKYTYDKTYTYDTTTFADALKLLDMVELLVDNGYCYSRSDYYTYAPLIAEHAIDMEGEKVPALAVINTYIAAGMDVNISSIPLSTYVNTFVCANYFRYDGLGYPTFLPASSLYALKVVSMFSTLTQYNPIYNKTLIPVQPVDRIYSEIERQNLLQKGINSLKILDNAFVFNNNITLASLDNNIFKEENIRRLANKVAKELKFLLKKFLGQRNVQRTRDRVISLAQRMYAVHIEPHEYKPDEFRVICDNSNNRDYDRYLYVTIIVKMPLSIKYIELVTVAMDLENA